MTISIKVDNRHEVVCLPFFFNFEKIVNSHAVGRNNTERLMASKLYLVSSDGNTLQTCSTILNEEIDIDKISGFV